MGMRYFGTSVQRQEDQRFLTGKGRYIDDIDMIGMLHGAFLRADLAHAKIINIDTSEAKPYLEYMLSIPSRSWVLNMSTNPWSRLIRHRC